MFILFSRTLWLYFVCLTRNVFGQLARSPSEQSQLPSGYCRLPSPPQGGSVFSVHCYSEDNPATECLNVPDTPVQPGWILTYICDKGYYLPKGQGYVDIRCTGGQWVPPPPICSDRICSPPTDPPNGQWTQHPLDCVDDCDLPYGPLRDNSLLTLQCVGGYVPGLDNSALCVGGNWILPDSCQQPEDKKKNSQVRRPISSSSCMLPEPPEHGSFMSATCYSDDSGPLLADECNHLPGTLARHGWTLTFLCDDGYLPSNNQTYQHSKCVHGRWIPPRPQCLVSLENGCTVPSHPAHGQYTVSCPSSGDSKCTGAPGMLVPPSYKLLISCSEGFHLTEDYALSSCDQGSWSPPPATCANSTIDLVDHRDISDIQSKFAGCVLPEPPAHGSFALFGRSCYNVVSSQSQCLKGPGEIVPHLQVLSITCDEGYQLSGQTGSSFLASCDNSRWSQAFPQCFKPCPKLSSHTVDIECYQGPNPVACDSAMLPGFTAVTKCKLNHATIDDPRDLICKSDGQWSGRLPICKPNCGLSKLNNYEITPTIVGGSTSLLGYFPWHAGIYHRDNKGWEAKCGGTLISPQIVLTAAHCVTQRSNKMKSEDVRVAMGKYFRDWNHNESETVRREVKDIQILPNYLGQESFLDLDIALMALDSPVSVSSFIMPACVDYYLTHRLRPNMIGYLAGWGKTQECSMGQACGDGSDTLIYTNTSFLSFRECYDAMQSIKKLPFSRITTDKFCAGNGSMSVAQKGDSGGGITFEFGGVHYVKGVISAKISLQDSYSFSAFTNVTHHLTWIYKMASYFDNMAK